MTAVRFEFMNDLLESPKKLTLNQFVDELTKSNYVDQKINRYVNIFHGQILRHFQTLDNDVKTINFNVTTGHIKNTFIWALDYVWMRLKYDSVFSESPTFFRSDTQRAYLEKVTKICSKRLLNRLKETKDLKDFTFTKDPVEPKRAYIQSKAIFFTFASIVMIPVVPLSLSMIDYTLYSGGWFDFKMHAVRKEEEHQEGDYHAPMDQPLLGLEKTIHIK